MWCRGVGSGGTACYSAWGTLVPPPPPLVASLPQPGDLQDTHTHMIEKGGSAKERRNFHRGQGVAGGGGQGQVGKQASGGFSAPVLSLSQQDWQGKAILRIL
jgi:hypothetical protein